jgi:hypothetical protein
LLRAFIGSVGYLADDIPNIRLPLGVLSAITGDTVPFRWTHTEQRASPRWPGITVDVPFRTERMLHRSG